MNPIQTNPRILASIKAMETITLPDQTRFKSELNNCGPNSDIECFKRMRLNETHGPGVYQLNSNRINNPLFSEVPGQNVFAPKASVIDIESEFRGLNNINTKCPNPANDPYLKFQKNIVETRNGFNPNHQISTTLLSQSTKTNKSCESVMSIKQDRYEFPTRPMQIQSNNVIGVNSRQSVKDKIRRQ